MKRSSPSSSTATANTCCCGPTLTGSNIALWLAAPAMLVLGGGIAVVYLRRRTARAEPEAQLSAEEQARLKELLRD
jgi:cytochrome c-type biogenesis protein CcmH